MATLQYLTTTEFDFGAINLAPKILKRCGITRPLLVTDAGLVKAGLIDKVRAALGKMEHTVFDGTPENPTEEAVEAAHALYKDADCDGIFAVGGGSSMDLGKGVAILVHNKGPLAQYALSPTMTPITQVAPLVAAPTTAGTGSEVSVGAVVITRDGRKSTFAGPKLIPLAAICDPDLTLSLPARLTAATGMDAVTHCIEAFLSPQVNPPADGVARDGLRRAVRNGALERVVKDGQDKQARWDMMMASTEGALSFIKGLGAVHSMSHSCGRHRQLKLHHGTLNAVCLPAVLRFNRDHVGDKYEDLRETMGLKPGTDLSEFIADLNSRIAMPANLAAMGVSMDLPGLLDYAVSDFAGRSNPRMAAKDDYVGLFRDALGEA